MPPRTPAESYTETVHFILPNDANPMGFALGGHVMHQIDLVGAIAAVRHTRAPVVTAAVDGLQFLHPIQIGDLMIVTARVTGAWNTSLEVEVQVFTERTLTGERRLTSSAYLTFVTVEKDGRRPPVPQLLLETDADRERAAAAEARRAARLATRRPHQA
jgi:acyl-CoA hydrolase